MLGFAKENEIVASSLIIILGWFIVACLDRKRSEYQFVMDKKFQAYELLQKYITDYSRELNNVFEKIIELQFALKVEFSRSRYERWGYIQNDIFEVWLKASSAWIEFHRTFENYRITLAEIEDLFFKFLDKYNDFVNYIQSKTVEDTVDYSDIPTNVEKRTELERLLKELSDKIMEQLVFNIDAVTGFQNRLFSEVFKRTVPKREPVDQKCEVLE